MQQRYISALIFTFSFLLLLASCSSSKKVQHGKKAMEIGEYHRSIALNKKAYKRAKSSSLKADLQYRMGYAHYYIGEYKKAEPYFRNAVKRSHANDSILLILGDTYRINGKFEEAVETYQAFLQNHPGDETALAGITSCDKMDGWLNKPTRYQVENMKAINSKWSDIAAVYPTGRDNRIIFTSTRDGAVGKRKSNITGQTNSDLFVAEYDRRREKWDKPVPLESDLVINTADDEGVACFDNEGQTIFFTRCRYDKTRNSGAEIYQSDMSGDEWGEPQLVTFGGDTIMVAHPSLSADGTVLYFVSDMDGGYGGNDIWMSTGGSGNWEKPVNMGPEINTPGNEMFPFIRDNDELYFSSDGHLGLGGLDIFKAYKTEDRIWHVENMGAPINSNGDDFAIYYMPEENKGLFSSNRKGSRRDDIYSFVLPPKIYEVKGEVYDKETQKLLTNATVRLIGTDGTQMKVNTSDGYFKFKLNPETEYIVAAFKKGYLNAKFIDNTIGLEDSKEFFTKLELTPTDAPINVENIFFAFGEHELQPESKVALDSLVSILELNPTITIELMAHTDCVGDANSNQQLSQRRAQSVVNYLIQSGIRYDRLVARGYGKSAPKTITKNIAKKYDFLEIGTELTCGYIDSLESDVHREECHQINRRVEFKVLSTNYRQRFKNEVLED